MTALRSEIWLANLNPSKKANEVGKIRPVLIFQNDELNRSTYPTTVILPLTTALIDEAKPLRFRVNKRENLKKDSLGIRSYERMMSIVKRLKEDKRFEKAGELAEKLLREKEILKKKGTSSKTFSIPNKVKEPVEKISLAEEYEKILKEKGFLPKNREIPNHKKLEIGEILYRMKEILEEDKISVDKVTFRLR